MGLPLSLVGRIRLDKQSKVPIQHQLQRHIQFLIFSGELREGDRLPSYRDLAEDVGVNRNTISHVYSELEREGWVRGKPGSGTFVQASGHVQNRNLHTLQGVVDEAVERAVALGFREEDLLRTLQGRLRMRAGAEEAAWHKGRKIADRSCL